MSTDDPDHPELAEVAPDGFLDTWGASSYKEALERAQQQPTTTPDEELPRCPTCGTRRVYPKGEDSSISPPHEHDTEYVCTNRHHFDGPIYGDEDPDPFVWVSEEDLAQPPLDRQPAALDDETLTALTIYCYRPWEEAGPSYRTLASIWPCSSDWIGDRVREWKEGEHHDLVRDPRPRVTVDATAGTQGVEAE